MAVTKILNGVTVEWGSAGAGTSALGIVRSASVKKASEKEQVPNNLGETVGLVLWDQRSDLSMEVIAVESVTQPAVGDAITIGGVAGKVLDCELKWENKGLKGLSITAVAYAAMVSA
jgi:hypothetical protein